MLSTLNFGPVSRTREWNTQLATDFAERNIGDAVFNRQCTKRLQPDFFVECFPVPFAIEVIIERSPRKSARAYRTHNSDSIDLGKCQRSVRELSWAHANTVAPKPSLPKIPIFLYCEIIANLLPKSNRRVDSERNVFDHYPVNPNICCSCLSPPSCRP